MSDLKSIVAGCFPVLYDPVTSACSRFENKLMYVSAPFSSLQSMFPTKLFLKNWQDEMKAHYIPCLSNSVEKTEAYYLFWKPAGGFNECIKPE